MKKATLFDVRTIIGVLLGLYGVILLLESFGTSEAEKARADGINANLWVGLVLIVFGVLMVTWAVTRPIVVDEEQLEADRRAIEEATAQSRQAAHHAVEERRDESQEERERGGSA
jgi:flagellar biosynthesis/type III secretory pathway M-ring protein FliF/YscJ